MPVGTAASVKAVHQRELESDVDAPIILGNTYHLYLRPGMELMEQAGGLHRFMHWNRSLLTDSGGYQVFSLAENRKITEEGALFRSHVDGSKHLFTPENVMEVQRTIGADIMMAFDECPPYPAERKYVKNSMELTHRWLERCRNHYEKTPAKWGHYQALFPIVQGGVHPELRAESAEFCSQFATDGIAIGGLSVGEPIADMYNMTEQVCDILPKHMPRYLMGVGTPANLLECIARGVDMFDCVMPTRNGRNGMLFTTQGIMNMRNKKWADDFSPIDEQLGGYVSTHYSKAYLRHLTVSKEMLASQIASVHNLRFYLWLVREARKHIVAGDFSSWKEQMVVQVSRKL